MSQVKYFLGVDCATKRIDIVVLDRKKNWVTSASLSTDEVDIDRRLVALYADLYDILATKIIKENNGDFFAAIENPIYIQNVKVTVSIAQTVAGVKIALGNLGVNFVGIDNRAWKKAVLGDGNSDKEKIKAFAITLWGDKIKSQDLADASLIALWASMRGS